MEKVKSRRSAFVALCAIITICMLAAVMISLPINSTNAAEEGVLDGNTAEYTIVNDEKHPWIYDRDENVWYNNADDNDLKDKSGQRATLFNKVLTVNITSPGNVAFRYKTNLHSAINWQNTSNFYLELTKNGVANTILAKHGEMMPEYEEITIENLDIGDKIVFKYQNPYMVSFRETDRVYVQGLIKPPEGTSYAIKATADGNGTNGTIVCGDEDSASIEKSVSSGCSIVLKAKPADGYVFKCWKAEADTIIYEDTLNLTPTAAANYTAYFVEKTFEAKFTPDGWEEEEGGYIFPATAEVGLSTLTYEFVGEKYINYNLTFSGGFQYGTQNQLTTYLNGKNQKECGDFGGELPIVPYSSYPLYMPKGYIHIGGEGYHRLDFVVDKKDASSQETVEIKDWNVSDTYDGETTTIELSYKEDCGTVYIDGKATKPGDNITVPKGKKVRFSVSVNPNAVANWVGFYTQPGQNNAPPQSNYNELHGDGIISLYSPYTLTFNDTGANHDPMVEEETGFSYYITKINCHYIEARMSEQLSMPKVEISAIIDGLEEKEQEIANGGVYTVPYGSNTNIGVSMDDVEGVDETYHIKINGEEQEDIRIEDNEGSNYFLLSNVNADTTVTISRSAEGFIDSNEFTFTIEVVSKGGIEDILVEGAEGITVENDEYVPWKFSAALSGENGAVYMAGNSGLLSYYGIAVSTLKFHIEGDGEGFLHFDFSVHRGEYWLLYGDKPASITDTVTAIAYATDNKGASTVDAAGHQLFWINEELNSWQRIVARGRTGTNGMFNYNWMEWPCGANTDPETMSSKKYDDKIDFDNKKAYSFPEENWAHVSIPITVSGEKDIYISYYRDMDKGKANTDKSSLPWQPAEKCDYAAIRNVAFLKGNAQISHSAVDAAGNSTELGTVTATANEKNVGNNDQIPLGSRITFTATAAEEKNGQFYGWATDDGKLVSLDKEYSTTVYTTSYSVKAVFGTTGQYYIRNDGKYFATLKEALDGRDEEGKDKAIAGDTLIVLRDGLTISENTDIPAEISLVLPVDEKGADFHFGVAEDVKHNIKANATSRVPWSSDELKEKYKNYTLTVADGQTLTIRGTLAVGAIQHYPEQSAQGATSGKYNILDIQGSVVVENGGHLDVRGLVTGKGGITVKSGGKLTQPFMILDFSGGTNTKALFNAGVTPFKMYGMVNVQCTGGYTIEYGGALWGHASLYAMLGNQTIDTPFISTDKEILGSLLMLKENSKVTVKYDDSHARPNMGDGNNAQDVGKTTMTVEGGAKAGYMQFPMNINTKNVYFSLPYNYELILKKGDYDVENNFKLMPGSVVRVEEGATLNVKAEKGLHVYDSFLGPKFNKREYPTGDQLTAANYKPYASLIVGGTLNIEDGATFLGTVQTEDTNGKAKITVGHGVTLSAKLFDGAATMYGCNYTEYTLAAQVYDNAHSGEDGKGIMANLEEGKTYVSVADGATGWTLPGITFKYETTTSTDGNNTHYKDKDHHDLNAGVKTDDVTDDGLKGSWKAEHSDCVYDWKQLSEDEKNFGGANFKELDRQCTEIGCSNHDKKLLIRSEAISFSVTYKGEAFTQDDVLALFCKCILGKDNYTEYSYFTATVGQLNSNNPMQNAATYKGAVPITLKNGWFDDVTTTAKTFDFMINKFDVKDLDRSAIEACLNGLVYTGTAHTPDLTLRADGLTGEVSHNPFVWDNNTNASTDDSKASVTITGFGDNFTGTLTIEFTIAKANLTVTIAAASHTYGETPAKPDITLGGNYVHSEEGLIKAAITRSTNATQWSKVGNNYTVNAEATGAEVLKNYDIHFENNGAAIYEVKVKDIGSAVATAKGVTYNGDEQKATLSFTFAGYANTEYFSENTDYTVSYKNGGETLPKNAGTYTVTITGIGNYTGSITCEYVISKKEITVNIKQQKYTFDRTEHNYNDDLPDAWTTNDLVGGDEKNVLNVTIEGSGTNANTYSVTCEYSSDNYIVTFEGKESALVIEAAKITSVEVTGSYTYNGDEQTPTLKVMAGSLVLNAGEYSVSYDKPTVKNADTYTVTVTANDNNFQNGDADVTAQFDIEKKAITVTADNITGTYGDSKPSPKNFTVEQGGLVGGDQKEVLNVTLALQTVEKDKYEVGKEYTITGTGTAANYDITVTAGKYTVNKKAITVTAKDITGTYGDQKPSPTEFTVPADALKYGDEKDVLNVTLTLESAQKYEVGTEYAITGTGEATNYEITVKQGKYTLSPKEITVTINEQRVTYSAAKQLPTSNYNTDWTIETKNLVNGDSYDALGVTLSADGTCINADSYEIKGNATTKNYKVSFTSGVGKFIIAKKAITVTADNITGTYGDPKPSPKNFTVEQDGLVGSDQKEVLNVTLTLQTVENDKYEVGKEYTITGTGTATNYDITVKQGKYTVNKKAITVTAKDITGTYGDSKPSPKEFTVPEGALMYGDEKDVLNVTLTLAPAQKYEVGTEYTITGTGEATNYEITVKQGKYTLSPKEITVTINEQRVTYSAAKQSAQSRYQTDWTVEVQDLVNGDNYGALGISLSADGTCINADSYEIKGNATTKNYKVSFTSGVGKFIIDKKGITVTATSLNLPEGTTTESVISQLKFKVTGLLDDGNDVEKNIEVSVNYDEKAEKGKTFVITVAFKGGYTPANYKVDKFETGTLTIIDSKFENVKFEDNRSLVYNGTLQTIEATDLPDGAQAKYVYAKGDSTLGSDGVKDVGNYTVTLTVTLAGYTDYTKTVNLYITQKAITIKANNVEKTYGEALVENNALTFTVPEGELVGDDNEQVLSVSLVWDHNTNVGDHQITGTATADNYTVTVTPGNYHIKEKEITVTIKKQTWATYNAESQNVHSTVDDWEVEGALAWSDGKETLRVTLTGSGTNAGSYKIDGKSANTNYKVTFEGGENAFVIAQKDITGAQIGGLEGPFTYKEAQWQPEITVTLAGFEMLKDTTDYTVEYGNNKTVKEGGTVTINGQGNFTGTANGTFKITPKSIDGLVITITEPDKVIYDGNQQQPKYTVTLAGFTTVDLTAATYGKNIEAGENAGSIEVQGKDNFTGTASLQFTIHARPITVTIKKQTWATYNAKSQNVHSTVDDWDVTDLAQKDKKDALNITLTGSGINAGSYKIDGISANTNYKVTFEGGENAFVIAQKDITGAQIGGLDKTFTYKEAQWQPEITVTLAGFEMLKDTTDYTVEYGNNKTVEEGGKVTINGQGNFTGTANGTFKITPKSIDGLVITITEPDKVIYDGNQQQPKYTVTLAGFTTVDLTAATYGKNIEAGENAGSIEVQGKDNFTGTASLQFTIHARPITVTIKKQTWATYNAKSQNVRSTIDDWDVTDLAQKDKKDALNITLTGSGKDAKAYDIVASWKNTNYKVTFKGADGLSVDGMTIKNAFVISPAALTDANLTSSHTYNGETQTPVFSVRAGDLTLAADDFELVFADGVDRISAGEVQVTVKAKSTNYSGSLVKSFIIGKKSVNATLKPQSFVYSGVVPTPDNKEYDVEEGGLCSRNGVKDDLQVTISIKDAKKDVGSYTITAKAGNGNYNVKFTESTLKITKKEIIVKADNITSTYGDEVKPFTFTAEGLAAGDEKTVLDVRLSAATIKEEGSYPITGSGSAQNYSFTVESGTYTVLPKTITVTISDHSKVYDGKEPVVTSVKDTDWTVEDDAIEEGDSLAIVLSKEQGVKVVEGGYQITGTFTNHNYNVVWVNGTYTIEAREVTVEIFDQRATYDYQEEKQYDFDDAKWRVDATTTLAPDEEPNVLGVTLVKPALSDAGTYEITAEWSNKNYEVTFTGSYEERGGTYTIDQLDISDEAVFMIGLKDGDVETDSDDRLWMRFAGKPLELTGDVTFFTDTGKISFGDLSEIKIDPAVLEDVGEYEVTLTIEDANFTGSAVFAVVVTNEDGYTERLRQTLARLKELKGDLTPETLQAEDFDALKEMYTLISELYEEEHNVASDELAEYEALMEWWNDSADIGDAIYTANKIGNALIDALFGTVAALTALCALAFVAMKGGLL